MRLSIAEVNFALLSAFTIFVEYRMRLSIVEVNFALLLAFTIFVKNKRKLNTKVFHIRLLLKIILPLIFIFYIGSISFFLHVHIVNGVTIVHSHPYQKGNPDELPGHEHTGSELQLIDNLSSFFATTFIVFLVLIGLLRTGYRKSYILPAFSYLKEVCKGVYFQRPPPFFMI